MATEPRSIRIEDDPTYWQALGKFIEKFASAETALFVLLLSYTKTDNIIGKIVFSGLRAKQAMTHVQRILTVAAVNKERAAELKYVFEQFSAISTARNSIVHYVSFVTSDLGRVASNITRAPTPDLVKEMRISPEILETMSTDLEKIAHHLALHAVLPNASLDERAAAVPALSVRSESS